MRVLDMHEMKIVFKFCFIVLFCSVGYSQNKNKELENELIKVKNQAFCDCYSEALSGKEIIRYKDGSSYMQIINLKGEYVFGNKKYKQMIEKWNKKDYKSYDPNQNLYLMKCLDFYNSPMLNRFIDSVRQEEIKIIKIR
ncbi:hypothetical protein [Flavobacterium sp. KACC 22763]|uniref:hypothetical protein n=1 Tax=Flavobacterium sp. KACC 22763 TaxID=3025668 RepID=UPI002365DB4C|nr:hypothetical protein [Flavobacterium sp. KACC 22763]WDF63986.1 hypothetical protein PQ463_20475 [Flavobacterium sp. KACC 22763]